MLKGSNAFVSGFTIFGTTSSSAAAPAATPFPAPSSRKCPYPASLYGITLYGGNLYSGISLYGNRFYGITIFWRTTTSGRYAKTSRAGGSSDAFYQ